MEKSQVVLMVLVLPSISHHSAPPLREFDSKTLALESREVMQSTDMVKDMEGQRSKERVNKTFHMLPHASTGDRRAQCTSVPQSVRARISVCQDCLIRGLQAHIRFLQDCLLEPDSRVQQVEEQLETERRRSWELEKSLERKALICEDLVARQQLETKLAAPIEEKGPRRSSTWDDSTTEGTSTARSNCTEEDEEVIEAFISQLAPTRPPLPASSGPPSRPRETSLARRARRQQERCRTLSQDVCALAALHQAAWSRPEAARSPGAAGGRVLLAKVWPIPPHITKKRISYVMPHVRPMGRSKMLPKQPSVAAAVTPSAGDVAGLFLFMNLIGVDLIRCASFGCKPPTDQTDWPEEMWLDATISEVLEDGSFRIAGGRSGSDRQKWIGSERVWAMDDSESEVPADYAVGPGSGGLETTSTKAWTDRRGRWPSLVLLCPEGVPMASSTCDPYLGGDLEMMIHGSSEGIWSLKHFDKHRFDNYTDWLDRETRKKNRAHGRNRINNPWHGEHHASPEEWFRLESDADLPAENRAALIGSSTAQCLREQVMYELASKNNLRELRELQQTLRSSSKTPSAPCEGVVELLVDYGVRGGSAREYAALCGQGGMLEWSLWMDGALRLREQYSLQFLQDLFLELDYDEEGQLTKAQVDSLLKSGAVECESDEADEILQSIDFDEDGYIPVGTMRELLLKDGRVARRTEVFDRKICDDCPKMCQLL
ncbi:unnamed protein product [Durusdinium trenchii]|uniref:Calmodulin n=1 Tax=Durusdinium trenchii TaxID=1381693 RepID=A0ABP0IH35_9DINO